jgi:DNA-binding FadR family transcriptional regulator
VVSEIGGHEGPAFDREVWKSRQGDSAPAALEPANRAEAAAGLIAELASRAQPEERLGSKEDLRQRCNVSVGTFNEALKIAQTRGVVTLRRGPGGGIFAARQTPLVKLGNRMLAMDDSESIVAEALRMRNALDPLVIDDALMHSSAADVLAMRQETMAMKRAMADNDIPAFLHGNWRFQALVAGVSPNPMLRSVFLSLLEILERHAVTLHSSEPQPLPDLLARRFELYERMADAMETRDRQAAMQIMHEHNTGMVQPAAHA